MTDYEVTKTANLLKAGLAVATVGGLTYLGFKVYKTYRQVKEDQANTDHAETAEAIDQAFSRKNLELNEEETDEEAIESDNIFRLPVKDFHTVYTPVYLKDKASTIEEVTTEADIEEELDEGALFPLKIAVLEEDEETFNDIKELSKMRFGVETDEAMEQFHAFLLAEVTERTDETVYNWLARALQTNVHITIDRDENLAMNIRENRERFFGEDAPEYILSEQTFAEVVITMAKKALYDWDDNDLSDLILRMMTNVNWIHLLAETEDFDAAVNIIMTNAYRDEDLSDWGTVGLFGLPIQKLDRVQHDAHYGLLDQYQDSTFGE